jgi:hypothetical protein
MALPPLSFEEARRILRELHELTEQHRIIVIGGQAVALWHRELSRHGHLAQELISPLTSKDIDFRGSRQSVERAAGLLGGQAKLPSLDDHTPSTGIVLFRDSEGNRRQIDFVDAPHGLSARDVANTAVQMHLPDAGSREIPVWVIHPERLMESRVHNVIGLGHSSAHAIRQLRASIECAAGFSRMILDTQELGPIVRSRTVLKLNERIYRFCRRQPARRLFRDRGIDPLEAVVVDHDGLPAKFREIRYPQMRDRLAQLEERTQRGWKP